MNARVTFGQMWKGEFRNCNHLDNIRLEGIFDIVKVNFGQVLATVLF